MCVWVGKERHVRIYMHVCVLTARIGVRKPVSLHLPPAELLTRMPLSADAHKCDQAIRNTLCGKEERSPCLSRRVL